MREIFVDIDGRRTRCLDAGAGWPVLLIHAFPLSADMWRPQLERVPNGYRYLAPDLRGFGPGSPPAERSSLLSDAADATTMDEYARDVSAVLDALHVDDAVIGGLSMGGYVTFALYRQEPERFTGMVLADTRSQPDTAEGRAGRTRLREVVAQRGSAAVADEMIPKLLAETSRTQNPTLVAETRRLIELTAPAAIDSALVALMDRADSTPTLPAISCPVLVIVGEHDGITPPSDARDMHRAIPRSMLSIIPSAGHLSNLERPDRFSHALHDFLVAHM